jgi:hypothetical protein
MELNIARHPESPSRRDDPPPLTTAMIHTLRNYEDPFGKELPPTPVRSGEDSLLTRS